MVNPINSGTKKTAKWGEHSADCRQMGLRSREVKSIVSQMRIGFFYATRQPPSMVVISFSVLFDNLYRLAFGFCPA